MAPGHLAGRHADLRDPLGPKLGATGSCWGLALTSVFRVGDYRYLDRSDGLFRHSETPLSPSAVTDWS